MANRSGRSRPIGQQRITNNDNHDSIPQQMLNYISYPFTACIPSTSSSRQDQEQTQSLLNNQAYEDSDAISLLSNIADRSRRRGRAAQRKRERWNSSTAIIGCGLFGRPKGQIQQRQRITTTGDGHNRIQRHSRSISQDSNVSTEVSTDDESGRTPSFGAAQESGDEDAGMLNDDAIANLSLSREEEGNEDIQAKKKAEDEEAAAAAVAAAKVAAELKAKEEEARKAKEELEKAAKIKEELERQAKETARIEAENAAKQKAEEDALAAEEEASIAKARRKAERKAIKQGLLEAKVQGQRNARRMTEAEAEAAAGGFDFAEETQTEHEEPQDHRSYSPDFGLDEEDAERYNDQYAYEDTVTEQAQPEIVHHHHYYHEPEQEESFRSYTISQPPTTFVTEYNGDHEQKHSEEEAIAEEDEDDADIAGLAFSKKRNKRSEKEGGSYASRSNGSGSGSRQSGTYERDRIGGSNSSARRRESLLGDGGSSTGGGSGSGGKFTYRDRPRRHERTGSRSAGSGSGKAIREGPGGKIITSPTIPESDQTRDISFSSATVTGSDDRADAAAGGFDDFLSPPPPPELTPSMTTYEQNSSWTENSGDYSRSISPNQGIKNSFSPASSTSAKAGRRRELPRTQQNANFGGLNAPRNPTIGNIFTKKDNYADDEADVEGF